MDWAALDVIIDVLAVSLSTKNYPQGTIIVGLSRGGLIPAVILSHKLGLPARPIEYSSKVGNGSGLNENNIPEWFVDAPYVIVVDDIADTGATFREINEFRFSENTTFVSLFKSTRCTAHVDFYGVMCDEKAWIDMPWEKK